MKALDIINLVFTAISVLTGLLFCHFMVFGIVGIFTKKSYPKTSKINRYGVIIPARNEERVVAGLIESAYKNNYPQDKLQVFVIAHNCTDRTAEIARSMGATVYEYNNPNEKTMGYAFRHLFKCIERDYGTQSFDGFFMFNADNILDSNYFALMNDAFEYYNRNSVITSFRNSKNFGTNLISGLYGMYFTTGCRMESRGRTVLGCSTRVQGTGYLINSNIVKDGWNYVTLTEDWEFSADQILLGNKIRYCDDAVFYDEQPTDVRIMWRQRVRWKRGHLLVFYSRFKDYIKALFKKGQKHKFSIYDISANTFPSLLIGFALLVLQVLIYLLLPAIDSSYSINELFLGNTHGFFVSNGLVFAWLRSFLSSYILLIISAIVVFIAERKRIKNVSIINRIMITLLWPAFLLIQFPMDIQALFSKNLEWKTIPHKDQTSFHHLNLISHK